MCLLRDCAANSNLNSDDLCVGYNYMKSLSSMQISLDLVLACLYDVYISYSSAFLKVDLGVL